MGVSTEAGPVAVTKAQSTKRPSKWLVEQNEISSRRINLFESNKPTFKQVPLINL